MRHRLILALLAVAMLVNSRAAAADDGYFSDGDKQLVFKEEGKRSRTEKITLLSLAGGALLASAVGGLYLLDAQSQSDEVSASGMHTLKAWTQDFEDTRLGAIRSSKIATISLGISGAFAASAIVAFIITQPDKTVGYQNWQTHNRVPKISPTANGVVMSQGWSF